jgi:hypothetical protein
MMLVAQQLVAQPRMLVAVTVVQQPEAEVTQ